jgi:hypothetical protein
VVPIAQTTIATGGTIIGAIAVAKITTGKGDGKK